MAWHAWFEEWHRIGATAGCGEGPRSLITYWTMCTQPRLDPGKIRETWKVFDFNNNGILSLAEIDKAVIELLPQYAKDKPAIIRAYKAADASKVCA